jgi:hypothetical protein
MSSNKYDSEFERLSKSLDDDERKSLLYKLKKDKNEPQFDENLDIDIKENSYQKHIKIAKNMYHSYSFLAKLLVWITSFFLGKKKEEVVLDRMFEDIKRQIISINGAIVNFKASCLTNDFEEMIIKLSESCDLCMPMIDKYFSDPLYYNKIVSNLIEEYFEDDIKSQLINLEPKSFDTSNELIDKEVYLNEKEKRLSLFFNKISYTSFNKLNDTFINLELFVRLVSFDYKTLLYEFSNNKISISNNKYGIKFSIIADLLEKLYFIINSINFTYNDINIIENLVKVNKLDDDILAGNIEVNEYINTINKILNQVEYIKAKVPFKFIFQYFKKDILYKPQSISIKLDLIQAYKDYKRQMISNLWEDHYNTLKEINQRKMVNQLIKDYNYDSLLYFNLELKNNVDKHSHVKLAFVKKLNLIYAFIEKIYKREIEKIINKIILEGDFLRDSARNTLTSSYYILYKSIDLIKTFDEKLNTDSDYGRKINTFIKIAANEVDYAQTLQNTIIDINEDAHDLIEELYTALWNLNNTVSSFIKNNEFDTSIISNLVDIKIVGYANIITVIMKIIKQFNLFFKVYDLLDDY